MPPKVRFLSVLLMSLALTLLLWQLQQHQPQSGLSVTVEYPNCIDMVLLVGREYEVEFRVLNNLPRAIRVVGVEYT